MEDSLGNVNRRVKTSVMEELEYWNVIYVIRKLTSYYNRNLSGYRVKQLQGLTGYDFAMNVLEKIVSGQRSWENSKYSSFIDFCYSVAKSEFSSWKIHKFKHYEDMGVVQENKSNLHIRDNYDGF